MGRSKVILSREDHFSVEARHRFGHCSRRKLFFVHIITHHLWFLYSRFLLSGTASLHFGVVFF